MRVTRHAAQRFLERVMKKENYSIHDIDYALRYLHHQLAKVIPTSYARPIALPEHKGFKVIHQDGTALSIVPSKWVKYNKPPHRKYYEEEIVY